jgi:hypothetical protein
VGNPPGGVRAGKQQQARKRGAHEPAKDAKAAKPKRP